jgi:MFS family permease
MLKGMGLTVMQVGLYSALPAVCGVAGAILVGRHSDRTGERRWHFGLAALAGAAGLVLASAFPTNAGMAVLCLALASAGISSAFTVLWAMPGSLLGGQSAAAGIAIISTIGGSAGMVAPVAVGAIKAATGGFTLSLYLLSFALVIAAVILMAFFRPGRAFSGARNLSEAR